MVSWIRSDQKRCTDINEAISIAFLFHQIISFFSFFLSFFLCLSFGWIFSSAGFVDEFYGLKFFSSTHQAVAVGSTFLRFEVSLLDTPSSGCRFNFQSGMSGFTTNARGTSFDGTHFLMSSQDWWQGSGDVLHPLFWFLSTRYFFEN